MGALVMHRIRCIAKGGFKINNGSLKNGKGLMIIKEISDTSNEASLPKPTQAGRIETCMELISKEVPRKQRQTMRHEEDRRGNKGKLPRW
jgi:hypothetical protein